MFDPSVMIMSDRVTRHHVLSARPGARTVPERPPRRPGEAVRRLAAVALRRLADRLEPRRACASIPASS